jgi:hypothetical protein
MMAGLRCTGTVFPRRIGESTRTAQRRFALAQEPPQVNKRKQMSRPLTAALLSALVFPGAGHIYLKRKGRALLFIVPTLVAVAAFVSAAMEQASALAGQILSGALPADPAALAARLEQQGDSALANAAAVVMVVCWLCAIADAWLLARRAPSA